MWTLRNFVKAGALAVAVLMFSATAALADNVHAVIADGNNTITAGGSTEIDYWIAATGAGNDGQSGCNAADGSSAIVSINAPAQVTATPSSLTFSLCGVGNAQQVTFSSGTPGAYNITASVSDAGSTATVGTYSTSQAAFTLTVNAASSLADTTAPQNVSVEIDNGATWTNSSAGAVVLDLSATDNVGITRYRLAESQAGLGSAVDVAVSPAEASFSRNDLGGFSLTGAEASSKAVWLRACDAANNCAEGSDTIGWDKTPPSVQVTGVANGATYTKGSVPTAGCDTQDALSDVASSATLGLSGPGTTNANGVGSFTATCSGATDVAGNAAAPVSATYSVHYGGVSGILQPINPNNSSVFSRGKAVPVKFQLGGDESTGYDFSGWTLQRVKVACTSFTSEEATLEAIGDKPSNAFRYDASADQYVNNASFSDQAAGTCWKVRVTLDSGQVLDSAVFKLQK